MNTQFKKGVLELIVLKAIVSDDLYGYQLVSRINEVIQVRYDLSFVEAIVERSFVGVLFKRIYGGSSKKVLSYHKFRT